LILGWFLGLAMVFYQRIGIKTDIIDVVAVAVGEHKFQQKHLNEFIGLPFA